MLHSNLFTVISRLMLSHSFGLEVDLYWNDIGKEMFNKSLISIFIYTFLFQRVWIPNYVQETHEEPQRV